MQIPNFMDIPVTDKSGMWTDEWRAILEQLITQLQQNAGPEGLVAPSQSAANIALLVSAQNGTIIYDSTNNLFKGYINGSWKTFTLT